MLTRRQIAERHAQEVRTMAAQEALHRRLLQSEDAKLVMMGVAAGATAMGVLVALALGIARLMIGTP